MDAVIAKSRHIDTYGIAQASAMSIHSVSPADMGRAYHCRMADTSRPWLDWGHRFRVQIKDNGKSLAQVAALMTRPGADEPLAESTLRSWTNGSREINLSDLFWLCETAEVDPAVVLFGQPILTDVQRKALGELTTSLISKDPTSSPNYEKLGNSIRKRVKADRAAMSRAPSRLKP